VSFSVRVVIPAGLRQVVVFVSRLCIGREVARLVCLWSLWLGGLLSSVGVFLVPESADPVVLMLTPWWHVVTFIVMLSLIYLFFVDDSAYIYTVVALWSLSLLWYVTLGAIDTVPLGLAFGS